jgi:hypothetical protein
MAGGSSQPGRCYQWRSPAGVINEGERSGAGPGAAGCSVLGWAQGGCRAGRTILHSDWRLDISPCRAGLPGGRLDSRGWLPGKGVHRQN